MLDLYFWPTGNGKKTVILLEELGIPYTLKPINIGRGDQLTPEFLKISPNGRMPALVDDEPMGGGEPISIFESGAIMTYIAEKEGRFLPSDPRGVPSRPIGQGLGCGGAPCRRGVGPLHEVHQPPVGRDDRPADGLAVGLGEPLSIRL